MMKKTALEQTLTSEINTEEQRLRNAPSIALLKSWLAEVPTTPEEIQEAEEAIKEFKKNLDAPRKEAGARLLFPENA
jgi:hypothetical protein